VTKIEGVFSAFKSSENQRFKAKGLQTLNGRRIGHKILKLTAAGKDRFDFKCPGPFLPFLSGSIMKK
jgi:hypothetical protein